MSIPVKVNPGRVDEFAKAAFNKLLKAHANPQIQFACKVFAEEITECFEENLGPGTKAHEIGQRIVRAMGSD